MPDAEEKVCHRQTRKEKNTVEIHRKAEAGDAQKGKEGESERLITLAVLLGYMNKIWAFRGGEAGNLAGMDSAGKSVHRGSILCILS